MQKSPLEVAEQSVQIALDLAKGGRSVVLAMGENHDDLSHHVTQALTLRELFASGQKTTFFMENPHNRLHTILLDRGYDAESASRMADYITARDPDGHITAKALIAGNPDSSRGQTHFIRFAHQTMLQTAIHHGVDIVYADAARVYPQDFCMDYSDRSTNEIALKLNARKGPEGEMSPDDMLIRNTHMAETIKARLEKTGGMGLAQIGAAHGFGTEDESNGLHRYQDSMAVQFQKLGMPAVMISLVPDHPLPPDYKAAVGEQQHVFNAPSPSAITQNMSNAEIEAFLTQNGMDPNIYDPRKFAKKYRAEFDAVVKEAKDATLDLSQPVRIKGNGLTSNILNPTPEQHPIIHLAVDIHHLGSRMGDVDWNGYLNAENGTIQTLKDNGIRTTYLAMSNRDYLHPANQPRDPGLAETGLAIAPQANETAIEKRLFNGFTTIENLRGSTEMMAYAVGQRSDNADYIARQPLTGASSPLQAHLATTGAKHVVISGGMADFCVTENALGAAMLGADVTILSDRVLGWNGKGNDRQAVWHPNSPAEHAQAINDRLDEIIRDPATAGYQASDKDSLIVARSRINIRTNDEFLALLPGLQADYAPPSMTANAAPALHSPATPARRGAMLRSITPPVQVETVEASTTDQAQPATAKKAQSSPTISAGLDA